MSIIRSVLIVSLLTLSNICLAALSEPLFSAEWQEYNPTQLFSSYKEGETNGFHGQWKLSSSRFQRKTEYKYYDVWKIMERYDYPGDFSDEFGLTVVDANKLKELGSDEEIKPGEMLFSINLKRINCLASRYMYYVNFETDPCPNSIHADGSKSYLLYYLVQADGSFVRLNNQFKKMTDKINWGTYTSDATSQSLIVYPVLDRTDFSIVFSRTDYNQMTVNINAGRLYAGSIMGVPYFGSTIVTLDYSKIQN